METMIGTANFNYGDIVRLRHNTKKDKILYINMRRLILTSQSLRQCTKKTLEVTLSA